MLHLPSYRERWKAKLAGYRKMGVVPVDEGMAERRLIITQDGGRRGLDAPEIERIIDEVILA